MRVAVEDGTELYGEKECVSNENKRSKKNIHAADQDGSHLEGFNNAGHAWINWRDEDNVGDKAV
jgi:hypothetical protein